MLEHEQSQDDLRGRTGSTAPRALWPAASQDFEHAIDERLVVEQRVEPAQRRIHELFGSRQQDGEERGAREGELRDVAACHARTT